MYTKRVIFRYLTIIAMSKYNRFHDKNFLGNHKCTASHYIICCNNLYTNLQSSLAMICYTDPAWLSLTNQQIWVHLWGTVMLGVYYSMLVAILPCYNQYYNMTVWHFGPCVTFWPCLCDISARLVWHFGPLVRNEGKRVSPYPHINHWRRL